jgi:hypothetical protein
MTGWLRRSGTSPWSMNEASRAFVLDESRIIRLHHFQHLFHISFGLSKYAVQQNSI